MGLWDEIDRRLDAESPLKRRLNNLAFLLFVVAVVVLVVLRS